MRKRTAAPKFHRKFHRKIIMLNSFLTRSMLMAVMCGLLCLQPAHAQTNNKPYYGVSGTKTAPVYTPETAPPAAPAPTDPEVPAPTPPTAPVAPVAPAPTTPTLPPAFGQNAVAPVPAPAAVPQAAPTTPPVKDPCAAYMNSYDSYNLCQDRIKKIERMKEAMQKRVDARKAASAPPAATPVPAAAAPVVNNAAPAVPTTTEAPAAAPKK